ncbi:hypothetical protein [Leucobacter denitrificans]|uniref:Uncharacterized protein n=1 Tax=Leucobacter denitrificans TaxID=683042 RepID=A0A7G9S6C9_9MICO|nr:hypothetical protein [Leucobacter denitrificans]QNN63404.1 hypothetical protein H9L06_03535 [Leucobacter denitrificans]
MKHATSKKTGSEKAAAETTPAAKKPYLEPGHAASMRDAGNGQGTYRRWSGGKTIDHPVMDGATQSWKADHDSENPWRGLTDPGLIVHPAWKRREKRNWFWR